jgi:hypothetical protein
MMAGQQFGVPPKNVVNLDYTGSDIALLPVTEAQRDPNVNDRNYPIDCFWRNTVTRVLWYLSGFNSTGGLWVLMTSPLGPVVTLSDTANTVVSPKSTGNIQLRSLSPGLGITANPGNNSLDFTVTESAAWLLITEATPPPASLSTNTGYFLSTLGAPVAMSFTLPATANLGDIIEVTLGGATSFTITQAAGQQITYGNKQTTAGIGGSLASTAQGDSLRMVAKSSTVWQIVSSIGNLVVV